MFEEIRLGNLTLKNRLIRSATWEGVALPDGGVTDTAYEIYKELAGGGVGAIITGFTTVAADDRYFGGMMRLCDDMLIPQYKERTDIIHAKGVPVISQLALGAYYRAGEQVEPDEMTTDEIRLVIRQFIDAAVRAEKAGFDGVQIHAAHFFFLSPANLTHMMSGVTELDKRMIRQQVERGDGNKMLPFPFMGWVECIADTAYDWQFSGLLNNVHTSKDGDFSQAEQITHIGALLVGTYDNFTDGDPAEFLRNLNFHMPTAKENALIFIEKTGHTYQMKHQEVADRILKQLQAWRK